MTEQQYKNFDDLPMFLNAQIIASVLGVSPSSAYELSTKKVFRHYGSEAALWSREISFRSGLRRILESSV